MKHSLPATATAVPTLTTRLRQATAEQHGRAERHPIQQALVRGQAGPSLYAAWLRAMRALHEVFEARLAAERSHPALAGVIEDHHFRLDLIDDDLDSLAVLVRQAGGSTAARREAPATIETGGSVEVVAASGGSGAICGMDESSHLGPRTLAAWSAIDAMIEVDPAVILGPFYVLEGSTNGGRFIAMAIRRSLALPPGAGTKYLDPHGDRIRERWAATKAAIDSLSLTPAQQETIIGAAQRTFDLVTILMDELQGSATQGT